MASEGPAALPWQEKIDRIVSVFNESRMDYGVTSHRLAERILVAIGDANE